MDASAAGREPYSDVAASDPTSSKLSAASCGIAVMAKASAPGRAKTRLVPPLDYDQAAALNTAFLHDVTDNILLAASRAAPGATIAGYAAYGPPGSEDFFRSRFSGIDLIPAWFSNFGVCLLHAIEQMFARGHSAAVVLNADSPTLPTALLNETAAMLAQPGDRAVLGPSSDGGYYLLGLKAAHRRMFEDIAWSTERVAEQTRERARDIGLPLHVLPQWYDVDDVGSLQRLHGEIFGSRPALGPDYAARLPHAARHTAALLNELWPDGVFGSRTGPRAPIADASVRPALPRRAAV
jgi:rSAM/selenodomain-associated transferase 1